ncbi:MAG: hypothetical protein K8F92_11030 [Hyphomicrobium sp.]|uniref:hypothetical protein n=1 Tax=Hyphomicrobium sp. TaxID=82 RepID=UPI0025C6BFF2|nr:hypothetical protein [Hyphomicrobium sp.]MBZ0210172.1 hypothetical protein [Hyphomicrobium sp.]
MTPAYSIMAGGTNIQGRVVSLEVADTEANKSDKAGIGIDDRNCEVVLPAKGALLMS